MRTYRRQLIDRDLENHRDMLTGRVLDLGGGRTRGQFPHGKKLGWVILDENEDFSPAVVGDATVLPFRNESFESVKCTELTGYLYEPFNMLREVERVLKTGGIVVFTAPFLTPFDEEQHDGVRLTSAWWRWAAAKSGFRIQEIKEQGYLLTVLADFERYWISHWWFPIRIAAYVVMFPIYEILFWWEQHLPIPFYFKRFTSGFLIVLKKIDSK